MRYSQIKLNDIANSHNGINLSIFTQGCPHHCKSCFNPETWEYNKGYEFTDETLQYIYDNIDKNIQRNLSILGGEPLCPQNIEGTIYLCREFKNKYPHKKIYLWTGYMIEEFNDLQKEILSHLDLLIDGKFEEDKKNLSLMLKGSSNQRIINVQQSLRQNKIIELTLE